MGVIFMGMTDRQFISYRKKELKEYEELLELAQQTPETDKRLIKKLEVLIEQAKTDIEAP